MPGLSRVRRPAGVIDVLRRPPLLDAAASRQAFLHPRVRERAEPGRPRPNDAVTERLVEADDRVASIQHDQLCVARQRRCLEPLDDSAPDAATAIRRIDGDEPHSAHARPGAMDAPDADEPPALRACRKVIRNGLVLVALRAARLIPRRAQHAPAELEVLRELLRASRSIDPTHDIWPVKAGAPDRSRRTPMRAPRGPSGGAALLHLPLQLVLALVHALSELRKLFPGHGL